MAGMLVVLGHVAFLIFACVALVWALREIRRTRNATARLRDDAVDCLARGHRGATETQHLSDAAQIILNTSKAIMADLEDRMRRAEKIVTDAVTEWKEAFAQAGLSKDAQREGTLREVDVKLTHADNIRRCTYEELAKTWQDTLSGCKEEYGKAMSTLIRYEQVFTRLERDLNDQRKRILDLEGVSGHLAATDDRIRGRVKRLEALVPTFEASHERFRNVFDNVNRHINEIITQRLKDQFGAKPEAPKSPKPAPKPKRKGVPRG